MCADKSHYSQVQTQTMCGSDHRTPSKPIDIGYEGRATRRRSIGARHRFHTTDSVLAAVRGSARKLTGARAASRCPSSSHRRNHVLTCNNSGPDVPQRGCVVLYCIASCSLPPYPYGAPYARTQPKPGHIRTAHQGISNTKPSLRTAGITPACYTRNSGDDQRKG